MPTSPESSSTAFTARSRCPRAAAGGSPGSRRVFLNLNDRFLLAELGRQPLVLTLQPLVLGDQRSVGMRLQPATLGRKPGQRPFVALLPPRAQMRRVQPLATQQGTELTRLRTAVGLAENADLVLGRKPLQDGDLRDGRVRHRLSVDGCRPLQGRAGRHHVRRPRVSFGKVGRCLAATSGRCGSS